MFIPKRFSLPGNLVFSSRAVPKVVVRPGELTIERPDENHPTTAKTLWSHTGPNGKPDVLMLDRIVHRPGEKTLGDWNVRGESITVLIRS